MKKEKSIVTIDVSVDFSSAPAGRDETDGPFSGQAFRKRFLEPSIRGNDLTYIKLDGVEGYGSSFLEEAFGGLVRSTKVSLEEFEKKIKLISEDDFLIDEIKSYLEDASQEKAW